MKRISIFTAVIPFFLMGCQNEPQKEAFVKNVITINPVVESGQSIKKLPGEIKESTEISLGFKTAGSIREIYVKEGSVIKKGQLLATLDDSDYQLGVEALQTQYDQLSREVQRIKKLYDNHSISGNDYDKAVSGLKQLELQLQTNKNKLSYTKLYAPVSGNIQSVSFEVAEMVNAGTPVFTILESGSKIVETSIPAAISQELNKVSAYKGYVEIGGKKEVMDLSYISVAPKADATQLYTLKLLIKKMPSKHITAGMNVDIEMAIGNSKGDTKYIVPIHSIFELDGKSNVWILENDNTVRASAVNVEKINEQGQAVLTSGVTANDKIIKAGVQTLHEGEKVKEIETAADTNIGGRL